MEQEILMEDTKKKFVVPRRWTPYTLLGAGNFSEQEISAEDMKECLHPSQFFILEVEG